MKANEFIKKFGIGKAVGILYEWDMFTQIEKPTHFDTDLDIFIHENDFKFIDESDVSITEMKRLVESCELVEKHGGIVSLNDLFTVYGMSHARVMKVGDLTYAKAMKAIEDVESCQ